MTQESPAPAGADPASGSSKPKASILKKKMTPAQIAYIVAFLALVVIFSGVVLNSVEKNATTVIGDAGQKMSPSATAPTLALPVAPAPVAPAPALLATTTPAAPAPVPVAVVPKTPQQRSFSFEGDTWTIVEGGGNAPISRLNMTPGSSKACPSLTIKLEADKPTAGGAKMAMTAAQKFRGDDRWHIVCVRS